MTSPVIKIKQGELKGKVFEDYNGNICFAFLGIPYAKPPLGELRFKAPQPPENWDGVRDATVDGNVCYNFEMFQKTFIGSEDCLIINVYTNEIPENKNNLKPVMVAIHGGAFTTGSSRSDFLGPKFLVCEDVVLVTFNYRLGALGFFSLNDPKLGVPGNAGLKDMVMALKWVKNNIEAFNGDPNNVTIFGESAGGAAVHYLMLSPMAKDLFHKAIALSGCATNLWACGEVGGEEIASDLGLKSKDEQEILNFLQNVSKKDLIQAQQKHKDLFLAHKKRRFGPVVEKFNHYEECFIHDDPNKIILSGNYIKVPLMMGYTSREGMVFNYMEQVYSYNSRISDFEEAIPFTLNLPKGTPLSLDVATKIKNFYFGNKDPQSNEAKDEYYKLQSDNFFFREMCSSLVNHVKTSNAPVYLYRFSIEADLNFVKILAKINEPGACHGDDLGYIFPCPFTPDIRPGSIEEFTMKRLTKYLTNFSKRGDPNPQELDDLINVLWKPVTKYNINFVDINENLTVGSNPEQPRMKFWESIFSINEI